MLPADQLWTFLIAITVLTITPGVDTLLIIRNTARGGWRDGAVTSLGICSGLFVHATLSAIGISLILLQSAWAFNALKLLGAGYLLWLGVTSIRTALRTKTAVTADRPVVHAPFLASRSLREGLLSNVLNPKAVIFYMAFLPQFIDPERSALLQSLLLAGAHFTIAMIWQCLLAASVQYARTRLVGSGTGRLLHGLTGTVLLLISYRLVTER